MLLSRLGLELLMTRDRCERKEEHQSWVERERETKERRTW